MSSASVHFLPDSYRSLTAFSMIVQAATPSLALCVRTWELMRVARGQVLIVLPVISAGQLTLASTQTHKERLVVTGLK